MTALVLVAAATARTPRTLCITAAVSIIISLPAYLCLFVLAISLSDGLSLALMDQQPGGGSKEGTREREEGGSGEQPRFSKSCEAEDSGRRRGIWRVAGETVALTSWQFGTN